MPADTTEQERHARIDEVLDELDLAHRRDVQISGLSGGQQKRVSIGVELLTKPGLFFLDEPSSGLDPGTETALMQLMRRLADQGRTIMLITHATKNVLLADKVAFLARGGYLAWYGPPDEALEYFDHYRSERERKLKPMEFDDIYALLADTGKGSPEQWAERYQHHPAYQQYIFQPLAETEEDVSLDSAAKKTVGPIVQQARKQVSSLRQFLILSARNIRILARDRFSLALMLAAAPLVGMLDVILSLVLGRTPFDFSEGHIGEVLITLFLLAVYGVMVGGLSQMREIVKEQEIYRRERLVNLKVLPYVLSKVWVAAIFALYQAAAYIIIHYLAFKMPGGVLEFFLIYITLALTTMAGMMIGLFASSLAPSANAAPMLVILFMLPQLVLGGALVPLPQVITGVTSTGWAFKSLMGIAGAGSDVAADICYQLPYEQLIEMTPEAKIENGCRCLGANALRQDSCNFPGVGLFYSPAIDEPPPAEPPPAPERPEDPAIPDPPPEPEDESDTLAVAEYLEQLEAYQAEVDSIQSAAEAEFAEYEAELEVYQAQVTTYQQDRVEWQISREASIQPVEGMIIAANRDFGWTFANKEDTLSYVFFVVSAWLAQATIIGLLFVGILIMQKRKDVN
jgi:energy-coupling factor transporter ATP-binding protein EcfA2